jgi:DNA-binding Lrp family transcriptional regulator
MPPVGELQQDGRLTVTELAGRVGLSLSPCHRRLRASEQSGAISGYHAHLDANALGLTFEDSSSPPCAPETALDVYPAEKRPELRDMIVRLADAKMSFGLSHGDLASGNVLVRPDGALVLIDWGAATCGPVPYTDLLILEHNHASDDDPSIKDLAAYAVGYGLDLGRVGPNFDAIRKADHAGPGQMGFGPTTRPAYGVCGVGPPGTHSTNQHLTGSRPRCGYFLMFFQTWAKVVRSRLERFVRPYTSASVIEAIAIASGSSRLVIISRGRRGDDPGNDRPADRRGLWSTRWRHRPHPWADSRPSADLPCRGGLVTKETKGRRRRSSDH